MGRTLAIASWLAVILAAGVAQADIRLDPPSGPPTPPSEEPSTAPRVEQQGCSSREAMAPEWIFGLAVLGLGAWGLRRHERAHAR
jgi:MYXO-CTERM domain-containing protein